MERLGSAINKGIAANFDNTTDLEVVTDKRSEQRYIKVRFGDSEFYVVPWTACYSWRAMEALLMEWYREDEDTLRDISNGDITIFHRVNGYIHPQTWEEVIEHGSQIDFWTHSAYDSDSSEDSHPPESKMYESSVQYVVNFRRSRADGEEYLVTTKTYKEPVEFEVADNNDRLPALQEIKDVLSPHHQDTETTGEITDGKKTKLGTHDRVVETSLKINSQYLLNVLKSVITYTSTAPEKRMNNLTTGLFYHPYQDLFHHLPDLLEYKNGNSALRNKHTTFFNEKFDEHLNLLDDYLNSKSGAPTAEFNARLERKIPTVTFATYWLLLKPGTQVYVRYDDGSLNAFILQRVEGGPSERGGEKTNRNYNILVWNLMFDGRVMLPGFRNLEISVFDNERDITSLKVFPAHFIDDNDNGKLEERLVERGKRFFTYCKAPAFLQYTGKSSVAKNKTYKRARVVVEHASMPWTNEAFEKVDHHSPDTYSIAVREVTRAARCECKDCRTSFDLQERYDKEPFSDYFDIIPSETEVLERQQYKIMDSHMYAFVLKDRIYDLLDVEGLEQASMAEDAISSLVMEDNNKEMIKAIARTYTDSDQSSRFSADFIHGKGEGQIILLHGPPGTGKTLTAESVAEYTKRPLLSITAADLGHEPEALETSLLRYFKRASDWDAIVLLDEADVYLEQRTTHDLKRNSIVSVFLRALDYFQGILFLTTNRVGHFDEAFMSRIHLSLGYEPLSNNAREKIWDNLFKKLQQDHKRGGPEITYEYDAKRYVQSRDVQALEWNGREIRNAFQTAVALAVFDAKYKASGKVPEVTEAHLKQVVSMSSAFRKYMTATHSGMDASSWAYKHGNREDKYPGTLAK
ncbi:P-loop containing nucleoside triphosphate hydrolase protein [Alternaria alternata]|uniref:p-loop containing nucleoside triphosphate hydrolase protein n=1 Tax=Alternaria alternata TaxID=5599 RepID=A0A177D8Z2_ALTAL|nr:P-loop containing nucleoside triphosphate hydrolase protein [Alternaria alternata]OAG15717.1 P-loop containing nucleoside triphosphate hydrolase protein [Alternaria alternata]